MAHLIHRAAPLKPEIKLAQALSEFEAILQDTDKQEFRSFRSGQAAAMSDVMKVTAAIDSKNSHRRSRRCFGPRLTSILESVQQFSSVVDIIIGGSQCFLASALWGTLRMTLQITSSFASYFENLSALFMRGGRGCPRYQEYGLLYPKSSRLQSVLCEYFCTIVILCRKAVLFIRKPLVAQLSSAILNPFRTEFGTYESQLTDLAASIREEASLASHREQSNEAKEASSFRTAISSIIAPQELQEAKKMKSQKRKLQILHACSAYNHQAAWKRARKVGTSAWIGDQAVYRQWAEEPSPNVLWCIGKLGSGKTVCTASLVQETIIRYPDAPVAYFFCSHDDAESLNARVILGSLVRQLLSFLDQETFDAIAVPDPSTFDEDDMTTHLLTLLSGSVRQFFVLIDGLDECTEGELGKLFESLHRMLRSRQCFHLFCSSRPDLHPKYRSILQPQYKVSLSDENPEIAQYIETALRDRLEAGSLSIGDPSIIFSIRDALLKGSQGMFLWVVFQLESICAELTDEAILNALQRLPRDLPETFDRILRKSDREKVCDQALRRKMFALVAAAQRPLTTDELREAISVEPGVTNWESKKLVNDIQKALAGCGSLLIVDEEDFSVRFAHHSVQKYITSASGDPTIAAYHVPWAAADLIMGEICVTYLNLGIFDTQLTRARNRTTLHSHTMTSNIVGSILPETTGSSIALRLLKTRRKVDFDMGACLQDIATEAKRFNAAETAQHPFLAYAKDFWLFHTRRFEQGQQKTHDLWLRLIDGNVPVATLPWALGHWSQPDVNFWKWTVNNAHGALLYRVIEAFAAPVQDSVTANIPVLCDLLFAKGHDFRVEGRFYGRMLVFPDVLRHHELLRLLLQRGVNINVTDHRGCSPLSLAAKSADQESVKLLLSQKDVPLQDKWGGLQYVLGRAVQAGWIDIVKLLLTWRDIDVNAGVAAEGWDPSEHQGGNGHSGVPLLIAALHGHLFELLLEQNGLDINRKNGYGNTALTLAAVYGHEQKVALLLARDDIDINSRNNGGKTALSVAVEFFRTFVVERLLQRKDVDVNLKDEQGSTALHLAILLIPARTPFRGLDLKRRMGRAIVEGDGQNAAGDTALGSRRDDLHAFAPMMRLLFARPDVDVNARNGATETPLHLLVHSNRPAEVMLMLERQDIDTEMRDAFGRPPLDLTLSLGHTDIAEALKAHMARRKRTVEQSEAIYVLSRPGGHLP
ncbi:hypothetical protein CLCR_01389 [Cladophialophora carrionii]|uniref:Uncharacterized protein n=1 Tax=Cladophialophora carrionii TaxID=86049 RepID=A0A1C1CAX9_9EURO|nr:hypothetical protein CLCR_01389 [Cladophialophora carrionii]